MESVRSALIAGPTLSATEVAPYETSHCNPPPSAGRFVDPDAPERDGKVMMVNVSSSDGVKADTRLTSSVPENVAGSVPVSLTWSNSEPGVSPPTSTV